MAGIKKANIAINRPMLSEMAISDTKAFAQVVEQVKAALAA